MNWQRRLFELMQPQRGRMLAALGLSLLASTAGIGLMAVSGHFIASMALVGAGAAAINYYTPAALVRLFAILRTGGRYAERLCGHDATLSILARLRGWLFGRLIPLAPAALAEQRGAQLLSRLRADIDTLEQSYLGLWLPSAVAACSALVVLVVAACWSGWFALLLMPLLLFAGAWLPWRLQASHADDAAQIDRDAEALRAAWADALAGRAELTMWGAEDAFDARMEQLTAQREAARARTQRGLARADAMLAACSGIALSVALLIGVLAMQQRHLDGPGLALLAMLAMAAFEPLLPLPLAWSRLAAIKAAAQRVFELADRAPVVLDPATPVAMPQATDLHLREVWMRHAQHGEWALRGLNLDLTAGTHLALVGASGAGKSSLAQLLGRLYPYQGSVTLGGTALDQLGADDVRARLAIVEQAPYLFDASLRDNLRIAAPDADDATLLRVLAVAQLDEFLRELPNGLDTWVGANGVNLSGGEARRLAIARALLVDAPVLVLDEPSEGLDALTTAALYKSLAVETRGRSVLLITHRLGGIAALVDEVAVIEQGRIVARRTVEGFAAQTTDSLRDAG
ncbi:thiol reductant ABC exporter subunit CydC [Luteibacter jiangsuensis]|uniref:Thiol reductant ABC exporter subunit CydC n=1 Tax=Luteibacter jiangsuensis TaxID=637577 RepID=A0ABX0Q5X6_9GAMM|nr:thiol reductant ABC exporter subunit CydC [Luteibacter jiangsuensis]NID05850.1 thiol reductant ABC exporter subunit CydC [Luteibacter jiangsuensis]